MKSTIDTIEDLLARGEHVEILPDGTIKTTPPQPEPTEPLTVPGPSHY